MTEAAGRREARRRRILANSDDRMKKLMGTYGVGSHENEGESELKEHKGLSLERQDKEENVLKPVDEVSRTPSPDSSSAEDKVFSSLPESEQATIRESSLPADNSGLRLDQSHASNSQERVNDTVRNKNCSRSELQSKNSSHHSSDGVDQGAETSNMSKAEPSSDYLKVRVALFVSVAVITRLVLISGIGILYFQSIILPFILTESSFFFYLSSSPQGLLLSCGKSGGSLLSSALMLCGIRPHIITTYMNVMSVMSTAFEDFAVYFFFFIVTHCAVECFG